MKNTKLTIAAIATVLVVAVGGGSLYATHHHQTPHRAVAAEHTQPKAKLTVSSDGKTVDYQGQTGKTALEVLKALGKVATQQSSYGEFVTAINGVTADGSKDYWAFYVNGTLASEGAGTYKTTNADKIEWRVEAIQ